MGSGKRLTRCEERAARARGGQCQGLRGARAAAGAQGHGSSQPREPRAAGTAGPGRGAPSAQLPTGPGRAGGGGPPRGRLSAAAGSAPGATSAEGGALSPAQPCPARRGEQVDELRPPAPEGPGSGAAQEGRRRPGLLPPRPDTPLPSARGSRRGGTGAVPGGDFPGVFCGAFWWPGREPPAGLRAGPGEPLGAPVPLLGAARLPLRTRVGG